MIGKYDIKNDGSITYPERIDQLWIAETNDIVYENLKKLGIKIPYITKYLWIDKTEAIKWAHCCLKELKDNIEEKFIREYLVEYNIFINNNKYTIATVTTTGLICDKCNNGDW